MDRCILLLIKRPVYLLYQPPLTLRPTSTIIGVPIRHYLAAGQWPEAAQIIERLGRQQLEAGYLGSLRRWIEQMPEAERQAYPWLNLFLGADEVHRGRYELARPWLEAARRGFTAGSDAAGQAETLVQLGEVFVCLADVAQARPILEESLTYPLSLSRRVKSQINLVWTSYYRRDWLQLEESLAATLSEVLASGDKGAHQSLVLSLGPSPTRQPAARSAICSLPPSGSKKRYRPNALPRLEPDT